MITKKIVRRTAYFHPPPPAAQFPPLSRIKSIPRIFGPFFAGAPDDLVELLLLKYFEKSSFFVTCFVGLKNVENNNPIMLIMLQIKSVKFRTKDL